MAKKGFFSRLFKGGAKINEDFYDELEEQLILGDMGAETSEELIDHLKEQVKSDKIKDQDEARTLIMSDVKELMALPEDAFDFEKEKSVVMAIGVNGVGKTTCVGKLANLYKKEGKNVILVGADTFRAAAGNQLKVWAERSGCFMVSGNEGADPGSVLYDGAAAAKARGADMVLCDTAGRLHNKANLMKELSKLDKIITAELPGYRKENMIILDAATGQNALSQAREFSQIMEVDSVILTKMDGTAKGGIAAAIRKELSVPVKYIGTGEKIDDIKRFDPEEYVQDLFAREGSEEQA